MTKIYNQSGQKIKRKILRKEMTSAEGIVWSQIRDRRVDYKFRRQYSIGKYVADFYCSELKLVIEIDGGQHFKEESIEYDKVRTKYFNDLGITVARYTNADVKQNLISVVDDIIKRCRELTSSRPSPC